ncbi:hypothetical protein D3C76_1455780 [compost metagenome]
MLVTTSGLMPGWSAMKSGSRGISQRTAKEGRTLMVTLRWAALRVSALAALAIWVRASLTCS